MDPGVKVFFYGSIKLVRILNAVQCRNGSGTRSELRNEYSNIDSLGSIANSARKVPLPIVCTNVRRSYENLIQNG
jgi:hypothetical protein